MDSTPAKAAPPLEITRLIVDFGMYGRTVNTVTEAVGTAGAENRETFGSGRRQAHGPTARRSEVQNSDGTDRTVRPLTGFRQECQDRLRNQAFIDRNT